MATEIDIPDNHKPRPPLRRRRVILLDQRTNRRWAKYLKARGLKSSAVIRAIIEQVLEQHDQEIKDARNG